MLREAIATGDTVEQAFETACRELGVESHEAQFDILEMPVKKKFGLFGGTPAKVRVYVKSSPADKAAEYLKDVLAHMGLTGVEVSVTEQEGGALLSLSGEDIGFVIGHRGETLDALQYLTGLVANHVDDSYYRITIDIGNYREKRKETLESLGKRIAAKAVKTGRNCPLEPMNPYERRIIHTAVQTVEGAKSWSEGEDTNRHVVIGPEGGERPQPQRRPGGKGGRRQPQQDSRGRRGNGDRFPRGNGGSGQQQRTQASGAQQGTAPSHPQQKVKAPLYGRIDVKKNNPEK